MIKTLAAVPALALLASAPAAAVTWGAPDTSHPYVGTLLFQRADGYYSCTGTLMSPTIVLTAAHCVEGDGELNLATWVNFDATIDLSNRPNYPTLKAYLDAEWIRTAEVIPHPLYEGTYFNTYDIGIVRLAEPVTMPTYGALPEIGLLDRILASKNTQSRLFTVVGYGQQGYLKPFASDEWARYSGTVRLIELNSTFTGQQHSAKFTNNPGAGNGRGGTCYGDSGGPVFYGTTNVVGAIVSWGITPCIGVDYQFRIDTYTAQDFLRQYAPELF